MDIDVMTNEKRLPVLFISHGAPNILLQQDPVIDTWKQQLASLTGIKRILLVSAHWETAQFTLGGNQQQATIHDFYGFPDALYEYRYTPPSDVAWAGQLADSLGIEVDHHRGLDHGSWVPLLVMFPDESIPVSQLSVSSTAGGEAHFELGEKLSDLRQQGVLIICSGVIVHNLAALNWQDSSAMPDNWASSFMQNVDEAIQSKKYTQVFQPQQLTGGKTAVPTFEHFSPLLVALGATGESPAKVFADVWRYGNLSQHSYRFG
jgi:4,5-DOPA dioxygenase extradiol